MKIKRHKRNVLCVCVCFKFAGKIIVIGSYFKKSLFREGGSTGERRGLEQEEGEAEEEEEEKLKGPGAGGCRVH